MAGSLTDGAGGGRGGSGESIRIGIVDDHP
ncbi:MAG: hypothetical protein QOI37_1049, partial [Chloroflexota bacterium]|nr:hypothetical protein [Chloroflexota bacterium]